MTTKTPLAATLSVLLAASTGAYAGNGMGPGTSVGGGTGPIHELVDCVELSGSVSVANGDGGGYTITLDPAIYTDSEATIYGFGPTGYWTQEGVYKPEVGENITVNTCTVYLSDTDSKLIATMVTFVEGTSIALRADDGSPLWRGGKGQGGGL